MEQSMNNETKRALDALASESRLTAFDVMKEGRDPASPLHEHFDWDDSSAAHKHRLNQARGLIQRYTVLVKVKGGGPSMPVRAYVNITHGQAGNAPGTYEARSQVVSDAEKRRRLLDGVLKQLEGALLANADLQELDPIVSAVQSVRRHVFGERAA